MQCDPIGTVHTSFETTGDAPRQGFHDDAESVVELDDAYREGLAGFDADRVVVVWLADRADDILRLDRDPERGVFTSRSPARPNPVCVTECTVRDADPSTGRLDLRGVDMADRSPVIDLKTPVDVRCWPDSDSESSIPWSG